MDCKCCENARWTVSLLCSCSECHETEVIVAAHTPEEWESYLHRLKNYTEWAYKKLLTDPAYAAGGEPLARSLDPETSHASAKEIKLVAGLQLYDVLSVYSHHRSPLTDHEVHVLGDFPTRQGITQRCSQLRKAKYIERSCKKHDDETGRTVWACVITDEGAQALARASDGELEVKA